jgi:hypothetical protein
MTVVYTLFKKLPQNFYTPTVKYNAIVKQRRENVKQNFSRFVCFLGKVKKERGA